MGWNLAILFPILTKKNFMPNSEVRFDVSVNALAPDLKIMAPAREWGMTRDETIAYAQKHDIPIPITASSPYSIDEKALERCRCLLDRVCTCGCGPPGKAEKEWLNEASLASLTKREKQLEQALEKVQERISQLQEEKE